MATNTNGITRADALSIAMERCADLPDVVETLAKMHASITKPRAKQVSKARLGNERLASLVRDAISAKGDGMSTKDIVNLGIAEITTTQKAAAVCRVACELGYLHKNVDGKSVTYSLA